MAKPTPKVSQRPNTNKDAVKKGQKATRSTPKKNQSVKFAPK